MDWSKLRIFKTVCDTGSLTKASKILYVTQSSLSRQITNLEEEVGVPLFHRHARGLAPTYHGDVLYHASKQVHSILQTAQETLQKSDEELSGSLKVSVPTDFGLHWLGSQLRHFKYLYPNLELELDYSNDYVDLRQREADVAIRIGFHEESDLFQRYLISYRWRAYATPGYLLGRGSLDSLEQLGGHTLLGLKSPANPWLAHGNAWLKDLLEPSVTQTIDHITANNLEALHRIARSSLGIVCLPEFMVDAASPLEPVLEQNVGPEFDLYLVCAHELRDSQRSQVFYEFVRSRIDKMDSIRTFNCKTQCPLCHEPPAPDNRWTCTCKTNWNTFETQGCCPGCGQHWGTTKCHHCHGLSSHLDWYVTETSP